MSKHMSSAWLAFIAIITLLFTNCANAQMWRPPNECEPSAPAAIKAPTTATPTPAVTQTTEEMVPYLISFDETEKVFKKEELAKLVTTDGDTTFYDKHGRQLKKNDIIRWFPKYNNDLEKLMASTKAMDVRTWYGVILGYGYEKPQADSLAKKVVTVIRGKSDSRPLISSVYENSPNTSRLNELEAKDLELEELISALESRIDNLPAPDMSGFVTSGYFNEFENRNIELWCMQDTMNTLLNTGLAAVDEQLSTTRGKRWEQMKVKHGVVQYFDFIQTLTVPKPVTEQISLSALPTTEQQPAKEKSKRGAMPRPHRH